MFDDADYEMFHFRQAELLRAGELDKVVSMSEVEIRFAKALVDLLKAKVEAEAARKALKGFMDGLK